MHLEVDIGNKSDRTEWGHARYQSVYSVDQVFELVIEWVAASGPIVSDLVRETLMFSGTAYIMYKV